MYLLERTRQEIRVVERRTGRVIVSERLANRTRPQKDELARRFLRQWRDLSKRRGVNWRSRL